MNTIKDKVVVITGGNSGIGKATVALLLEQDVKVLELSRSKKLSDEVHHPNLISYKGDAGREADVIAAFNLAIKEFGTVDILINNAGVGMPTPDLSVADLDTFDKMVNVNMRGVFLCNREALKIMKAKKAGHIITVVSMAGQRTNPNAPLYCATKFGARGLSSGLADQVLKSGIKVTDVNPGPVDSNYWGDRQVAREKFLQASDVARVILFVLSQPDYMLIREINFDNMKFIAG